MKKDIFCLAAVLLICAAYVSAQQSSAAVVNSYYVKTNGNDSNRGTSENVPFATLQRAIEAAMATPVKKITVIGTLNTSIIISDSGNEEIIITGKPNANEHEKAVLIILEQSQILFRILGNSNIRFENIVLQGKTEANNAISQGIAINEATVTLGNNVLITKFASNDGAGVFLRSGRLNMTGNAAIVGNIARSSGGGIYMGGGTLIMDGNSIIRNNEARSTRSIDAGGGGIFMWSGTAELRDNSLITGNTAIASGGGVYAAGMDLIIGGISVHDIEEWEHTFESGNIHGNSAKNGPDIYEMYG